VFLPEREKGEEPLGDFTPGDCRGFAEVARRGVERNTSHKGGKTFPLGGVEKVSNLLKEGSPTWGERGTN